MKRKQSVRSMGVLWVCSALIVGIAMIVVWGGSSRAAEDAVVLTIDDYPVTVSEFQVFLQNNKALTAGYFKRMYDADYSDDFWTSTYGGENPLHYAKRQTIKDIKKQKVEQIVMKEHGIIEDLSYHAFLKKLAEENGERQRKIQNNEPVYGPKTYGVNEFYSYTQSINYQRLVDTLVRQERASLSDSELKPLYEQVKRDYFYKGFGFDYEKIAAANGTEAIDTLQELRKSASAARGNIGQDQLPATVRMETLHLDLEERSKDDDMARYLHDAFTTMQAGELTEIVPTDEGAVTYRLVAVRDQGYEAYEQVKAPLIQIYVQKRLEQEIDRRIRDADVQINEEVLAQISLT
ncbi:hypothetical protein PAE9249_02886 [Paenibacillus sp. CECT 9249]|uniref:peptidylprolyl isomerase n=1 Tax=Paenibacillus sp. CECT 9249 TaxID=2845385 RepID=UPI001E48A735|nr:peptidylprolyl isomerase [Paenibacillus sp. CECT 9249]CAH0120367.1 hypothetical protein PAE9249_02886 [Paenibacillus sp. CECT 9249]